MNSPLCDDANLRQIRKDFLLHIYQSDEAEMTTFLYGKETL